MWVFDGEEWIEDGERRDERKPEATLPLWDVEMPELQVIEYVPTVTRKNIVPPLPLP